MTTRSKAQTYIFSQVLESYNHACAGCGSPLDLERDHVQPQSDGGSDDIENLQVLCHHCNNCKNGLVGIDKFDPREMEMDIVIILLNREIFRTLISEYR